MSSQEHVLLPPTEELPLFVYGTLLSGFKNHEIYLKQSTKEMHPARIRDVSLWHARDSGYPVIVDGSSEVTGELVWLKNFEVSIPEMDLLEGYNADPRASTYVRVAKCVVDLESGKAVNAYVYWYNRSIAEISGPVIEIPSGNWREFMGTDGHQEGTRILGRRD